MNTEAIKKRLEEACNFFQGMDLTSEMSKYNNPEIRAAAIITANVLIKKLNQAVDAVKIYQEAIIAEDRKNLGKGEEVIADMLTKAAGKVQ